MSLRFPVPPGVVGRVIQAASDPDTSTADLARLLEKDAVLTAQVLRTVNSASFGLRRRVASVDRAVAFMGMRAVRNLVLSLGVRGLVPTTAVGDFPIDFFWECSLRRAAAAQCLARERGLPQAEEVFTMGLCQDIGILLRLRDDAEAASRLASVIREPAERRLEVEREGARGHDELGFEMFSDWRFPEELCVPIRFHHAPEEAPEAHRERARVAHAAEALADLSLVEDKATAVRVATARLASLELEDRIVGSVAGSVNEVVREFAELLGLAIDEQPGSEEIIRMASGGLADLNLSYQDLTRKLEDALAQQERMATQLQELNRELERQARTDVLTRLANRRAFDEALTREIAVAERQGSPLSVLIIDIDRFKSLNDTHGHQAGDEVLREVGRVIAREVRLSDLAARHGGEEFAVVLPFTDAAGGTIAAERFRVSIESTVVAWHDRELRVTVSCGGATASRVDMAEDPAGERLMRSADEALYRAKAEGRNRVCWS